MECLGKGPGAFWVKRGNRPKLFCKNSTTYRGLRHNSDIAEGIAEGPDFRNYGCCIMAHFEFRTIALGIFKVFYTFIDLVI